MKTSTFRKAITIVEIAAAIPIILFDLFSPTLIILFMAAISLIVRHENIRSLGFKRPASWLRLIGFSFIGAVLLQLFDIGITMPILNRLTGATIDYGGFADLQGNPGQLLLLLALSWTLAALGEEIVYRGYIQKLLADLAGRDVFGILLTAGVSSLLFGLAHTEQGITGVAVAAIDALFFFWLKRKFDDNLWAAILTHGFYNTTGTIAFYFIGPIYGLW